MFDTYVRQDSVLLTPGEAGRNHAGRWRAWKGPWLPTYLLRRACPVCAQEPQRGTALMWRLPIMTSCDEHACRLEPELQVTLATLNLAQITPVPVDAHVVALDRRTREGLTAGAVTLPGRPVHLGVWFRLLRTLLDEVSISLSRVGVRSRPVLEHVWQATGRPLRAGLAVWRPYEQLDWDTQEAMLHAAAVALHLVKTGAITARGTLGSPLAAQPHRPVYDGDRPTPAVPPWGDSQEARDAWIAAARVVPDTAVQILTALSFGCRTDTQFQHERRYLIDLGIPDRFLPSNLDAIGSGPAR